MRPTGDGAAPSRRHLLLGGLGLGVFAVTGCSTSSAPAAATTAGAPQRGGLTPDVAAAEHLGSAIAYVAKIVAVTLAAHPGLGADLHGFGPMHTVHLATLRTAVPGYVLQPGTQPQPAVAAKPAAALKIVFAHERALHDQLINAAVAARDGRYARLFGSMSAAISQQLAAVHA